MSREDMKKVTAEISKDCWKALKVLAVQKEVSLAEVVKEVLEKSMSKKLKQLEVVEE
jgi:predicted HicB family RNase H-like nuclease